MKPRLVLASGSPRRSELLDGLGLEYLVRPADLDETRFAAEEPAIYVERLARAKAQALARPGELHLAADTTVLCDDEILGKPEDGAEARSMLSTLADRRHEVLTGVALHLGGSDRTESRVVRTTVWIAPLSADEIDWYVETGEPMDKAGAYAIQGLGALLVERIEGNYTNVVGLPLPAVRDLFGRFGYKMTEFAAG